VAGIDIMAERRSLPEGADVSIKQRKPGYEKKLCNALCKLAEGLGIYPELDGASLLKRPFRLLRPVEPVTNLLNGERVGVTQDRELPWRWAIPITRHGSPRSFHRRIRSEREHPHPG
jgi:DNA-3-methyladenine glycosylase